MARYPTFDDYAKRGNYQDGIKRCDDLLKKNPQDSQLLTVKLQLLYAAGQDGQPVLEQLATSQPALLDPWDVAHVEQIVVDSLKDVYPRPSTVGPAVAKLWDNALKTATNVNYKLDLLDIRFSRAVVDNRFSDAQQALIQLKALQPKKRLYYMAHAAVTQLLSTSKDDLQSRLALSLARKAVNERFDDDKALDCRVAGQIFAMQGSTKDLDGIAGRAFAECKQVYDAVRVGKPVANEPMISATSQEPSLASPRSWFQDEVTALKTQFQLLIAKAVSPDLLIEFANNAIRLFHAGTTTLGLASSRGPTDACCLAISALVKVFEATNSATYLYYSAFLAEILLKQNPNVHEARLILVYIYARLGLGSLAMSMFDSLKVKEIQHDTVGHSLLASVSQLHPAHAELPSKEKFDPYERTHKALAVYIRHEDKLAETEATILRHGQTGMLFDLQALRDSLRKSVVRRLFLLEHRRIARLSGKPVAKGVVDLGPRVTANWTTTTDNRDFNATFNYGVNVERLLYGSDGSALDSASLILDRLLIDSIWSLADKRPLLVNDIDVLIQEAERAAEAVQTALMTASASRMAEYLAGRVGIPLAKCLTRVAAKAPILPGDVDATVSSIKRLNVDLLVASPDMMAEHLADHFIYVDVLRVVVLACRYAQATADQTPAALQDVESLAMRSYVKLTNHAAELRAQVKAVDITDALSQLQCCQEGFKLFGDQAASKFCDRIATSAKEGWAGVGGVPLV